jgi:hypothetical protein
MEGLESGLPSVKVAEEYERGIHAEVRPGEFAPVAEAGQEAEELIVLCQTETGGWLPFCVVKLTDAGESYKRPLRFMLCAPAQDSHSVTK